MSLYFDTVTILSSDANSGGSLKSRVYNSNLKSSPAQLYALIIEVSKWDTVLKEVIDNAGILVQEPKLTPLLSLFLVHDLLISKKGIAAPATHPLRLAIERHKTRLKAEFTKCRVRRGCASVEQLKSELLGSRQQAGSGAGLCSFAPRWVRINNARTTLDRELSTTFTHFSAVSSLSELSNQGEKCYHVDQHVPDLLALHPSVEIVSFPAYTSGRLILQDKASCFPGYLLLGDPTLPWCGDIIDGCAAPGNKTTHLASLLDSPARSSTNHNKWEDDKRCTILSFDSSKARSKTLKKMVDMAGVSKRVNLFPGQDFLAVNPDDASFRNVTGLLLDPSCSGSGIRGREDVPKFALPKPRPTQGGLSSSGRKRKRKRDNSKNGEEPAHDTNADITLPTEEETRDPGIDTERLAKLSNLQTQIVEHAFKFPAATRVTYSTCSIHEQENENVVSRVLSSSIAKQRGWRILPRADQVEGMKAWKHRGLTSSSVDQESSRWHLSPVESDACIRCWPEDAEGTGGFFVVGFVRDDDSDTHVHREQLDNGTIEGLGNDEDDEGCDDESWQGFSD